MFKVYIISVLLSIILVIANIIVSGDKSKDKNIFATMTLASFIPVLQQFMIFVDIFILIVEIITRKDNKIKKEKQKYEALIEEIKTSCTKIYCFMDTNRYIEVRLKEILKLYETIIKNDLYKDSAYNQIKYLTTFIIECSKNKVIDDREILEEIKSMTDSLYELLDSYVKNINDINDKANRELKDYLKQKTSEFVKNNKILTEDFKKMNNI